MTDLAQSLEKLAAAISRLETQQGQRALTGVADAQSLFGAGGLFSTFGMDNVVINAGITPRGVSDMIPAMGTDITDPLYTFITGFESDGAAEPNGPCDDSPSGVMETCHQVATLGRIARSSKEMEVNELAKILNGHLSMDLTLLGDVVSPGHALMPQMGSNGRDILRSVTKLQMTIVGIEFQRVLSKMLWTGDPANNTAGGGYKEFPGLDMLISTGKVDAVTGVACAALDSDIKDFGYASVDSTSPDILTYLSMMMYYLQHTASGANLDPVDWVIVMRPDLFFELTAIWPCRYLTNRCGDIAGNQVTVMNDQTNVSMRDDMRKGMFLWINGVQVPVRTDDGIPELNSINSANLGLGEYASDIYILPLRAKGMSVLYWEYLDYSRAAAEIAALTQKGRFWVTDGGRYMWTLQDMNYCFKIQGKLEPRIKLRTPHLAGKLQNVKYSPLQHLRDPFPESPYFKKGGAESYANPTYYSEWNPPSAVL